MSIFGEDNVINAKRLFFDFLEMNNYFSSVKKQKQKLGEFEI
jgi:hypothetical protein